MTLLKISCTALVFVISFSLAASSPVLQQNHLTYWNTLTQTTKAVCDGSSSSVCSDDCMNVLKCPEGSFIESCSPGLNHCHKPSTGDARCSVAPRCAGAPLRCAQEGVFPDPYFCSFYHTCSAVGSYSAVHNCTDSAYNIATGECDLPLDDPVCVDGVVPECISLIQSGALPGNMQYYYRCRRDSNIFYHDMHMCPDGEYFDSSSAFLGECFPDELTSSSTESPTTITTTTTESTTTATTTMPTESPTTITTTTTESTTTATTTTWLSTDTPTTTVPTSSTTTISTLPTEPTTTLTTTINTLPTEPTTTINTIPTESSSSTTTIN